MEWEFTAEQVVKAEVDYRLEDFRTGLAEEVRINLPGVDEVRQVQSFNLIYDLCYALATNLTVDEFLTAYAYDPPTCDFLRDVEPAMAPNVEMLGAILQRMIMDGVERGMALDQAVAAAAERHAEAVAAPA